MPLVFLENPNRKGFTGAGCWKADIKQPLSYHNGKQ
jgi:hypothetical protein